MAWGWRWWIKGKLVNHFFLFKSLAKLSSTGKSDVGIDISIGIDLDTDVDIALSMQNSWNLW